VKIAVRKAVSADIPTLESLIDLSVRGLQAQDYTPDQIDEALRSVYGVDTQLIADETYYAAEAISDDRRPVIVACGGWSKRKTLYGGDRYAGREDLLLDPAKGEAAKIRAFFVHPDWARRGIGGMILEACENAASAAGFTRLEMGATLTGVPFYKIKGYAELEHIEVPMPGGAALPIVRMSKTVMK
jgi:GNAT superfamily N-acetyltransferase